MPEQYDQAIFLHCAQLWLPCRGFLPNIWCGCIVSIDLPSRVTKSSVQTQDEGNKNLICAITFGDFKNKRKNTWLITRPAQKKKKKKLDHKS